MMSPAQFAPAAKRGGLLLIGWAIASTLVGRAFTALAPGDADARLFAYIGLKWLHGSIPYVDIWDNKPPGIWGVNALVFLFFPKSFTALAWLEGIFVLGCIGTVYLLMRQCRAPWPAAFLATASVATASNLLSYNEYGNLTEIYVLWPAALSMYCFVKAAPTFRWNWIFLAGLFSGVASLFKPIGLSPLLAQQTFVILLWVVFRGLSLPRWLATMLTSSAGVLAAWLPFALYFWNHHAFQELVDASFTYNIFYGAANQQTIFAPLRAITSLLPLASLVAFAIVGLMRYGELCGGLKRSPDRAAGMGQAPCFWWLLAFLWVCFDLAAALAGGRNYMHYFLPAAASLSVAAGLTYWSLTEGIPRESRYGGVSRALFVLILGPLILAQLADLYQLKTYLRGHPSARPWEAVAARLNAVRGPADTLFTWEYLPGIYLTTEMNSPLRLLSAHYIFDSAKGHRKFGGEISQGLQQQPPTFIVDSWSDRDPRAGDPVYRQFRRLIQSRYILIYEADGFRVYRKSALSASNAVARITGPERVPFTP